MTSLIVVSAGLREPSSTHLLADRLSAAASEALGEPELIRVNLRDYSRDLSDMTLTGFASLELEKIIESAKNADAMIAVTPVFSGSFSGLFKNFFDVLPEGALKGLPTIIGATAGTARHSLMLDFAMRPLFNYLKADVIPTGVFAATEDFGGGSQLSQRVEQAANELAKRVELNVRVKPDDEFDVLDFEDLLGR